MDDRSGGLRDGLLRLLGWRVRAVIVVFAFAIAAFSQVTLTGGVRLGPVESVFHSIGLFFMSTPGMPESGPLGWIVALWLTYFLAPAITASKLADFAWQMRRVLRNPTSAAS